MKHSIKLLRTALITGLAITLILQSTLLAAQCEDIRGKVVRLHVLAHSDSEEEQQLKLAVRDALLTHGAHLLQGAENKEQAVLQLQNNLPELTEIAQKAVTKQGKSHSVTCSITPTYFNTRTYDSVTLPAGEYTALRVVIGDGNGQNWWCVMFPNLCIPSATQTESLVPYLNEGETDLVEHGQRYQVRFKAVEWFSWLRNQCRRWF